MPESLSRSYDRGWLGEQLVATWLTQQGWSIVQQRWRSRLGEIDLIATGIESHQSWLAFVEVKTRSSGNWDLDGLLAVTSQKQAKLLQLAQIFLAQHPQLAERPCRFDVALVRCQSQGSVQHNSTVLPLGSSESSIQAPIRLGLPIRHHAYSLTLIHYLAHAFDQS